MEDNNWKLVIEFDSLKEQEDRDPGFAFPNDGVSCTIRFLLEAWAMTPEEFMEDASWGDDTITLSFPVLDVISGLQEYVIMHLPVKAMHLVRIEDA